MTAIEVTLALPDELAREAEESGLLASEAIEGPIAAEVRRRRIERMFDTADRLAALGISSMSEDEVEAEIQLTRSDSNRDKVRQALAEAGLLRELSPELRQKADASVQLEDVRAALARAGGKPLSEIVMEQRGPKA